MEITFNAIGLEFEAEVTYKPFKPGKFDALPENCYPSEPAEIEFQSLTFSGHSAIWLLESHAATQITDAAMQSADEKIDELRDEAAADAMEAAEAQR